MNKLKLAIFASGNGSNAKNIIKHFESHHSISVAFVLSNKADAPIISWCNEFGINTIVLSNQEVNDGDLLIDICKKEGIDTIILAGYLRKIPVELTKYYENKMINIHPALLPKFGGKGMYGMNVHSAVKAANEKESGITIHYVNENFDEGNYIAQFYCSLESSDSAEAIQLKVQKLEHSYFPLVIERTLLDKA